MIARMFFHTLAAVIVIAGLAGGWQVISSPDQGWNAVGEHREWQGGRHDD